MKSFTYLSVFAVLIFTLSVFAVQDVHAVKFTGSQTGPGEWTYNLTYEPRDNFAACQPSATITLTNLAGVIGAFAPTSTDLNVLGALDWVPTVSSGGTEVVWTHIGGGTGNYPIDKHVFGFKVFANATDGPVNVATDGFSIDTKVPADPCRDLDIVNMTSGPTMPPQKPDPCLLNPRSALCQNQNIMEFDKCFREGRLICKISFDIFRESVRCYDEIDGPRCPLPPITEETLLEIQHEFPPLKQVKAGILSENIVAVKGQLLITNDHRTSPVSVTQKTADILLGRSDTIWHPFP